MASLSDISAAAQDADLRDRMISAAAELGLQNPSSWVDQHARHLVTRPVAEGSTDTITSVYAYARDTRQPPPGLNPGAVLDDFIRHAVGSVASPPE